MSELKITVSGEVGSGKSAMLGEIEILCKALCIPVRYQEEKAARAEKNLTHAEWVEELAMYKPSVVLIEKIELRTQPEATKPAQDLSAAILALPLPNTTLTAEVAGYKVPELWRQEIPDNAEFIPASNKEQT